MMKKIMLMLLEVANKLLLKIDKLMTEWVPVGGQKLMKKTPKIIRVANDLPLEFKPIIKRKLETKSWPSRLSRSDCGISV